MKAYKNHLSRTLRAFCYRYDADGYKITLTEYNTLRRRISKTVNKQSTYFLYAEEGLLAEMNASGQITKAYGWQPQGLWGTDPLWQATLSPGQTLANAQYTFTATDHLGTPQIATDANGPKVWKGQSEAFGKTTPEPGSAITQNLRFPGQYYDPETQMHQNYFRDYKKLTAAQKNTIRKCLVAADSKKRGRPGCQAKCNSNCSSRKCIDDYHHECFSEAGVPPGCYPGLIPYTPSGYDDNKGPLCC